MSYFSSFLFFTPVVYETHQNTSRYHAKVPVNLAQLMTILYARFGVRITKSYHVKHNK